MSYTCKLPLSVILSRSKCIVSLSKHAIQPILRILEDLSILSFNGEASDSGVSFRKISPYPEEIVHYGILTSIMKFWFLIGSCLHFI